MTPRKNQILVNAQSFDIPTTPMIHTTQPLSPIKKTFPPLPFS